MKESVMQSVRKLGLMQDRIDGLISTKKIAEAIDRQKQHFHLSTSFAVILFLHDAQELFNICFQAALRSWYNLMRLTPEHGYDLNSKKQILMFQLIAIAQLRRKRYKKALKSLVQAQQICCDLDETVERNLDYMVSVNTLSAYLLLMFEKPDEAIGFVTISWKVVQRLLETLCGNEKQDNNRNSVVTLQSIGEGGIHQSTDQDVVEDNNQGGKEKEEEKAEATKNQASKVNQDLPISSGITSLNEGQRLQDPIEDSPQYKTPKKDQTKFIEKVTDQRQEKLNIEDQNEKMPNMAPGKRTSLSHALLSNYILILPLLKNIISRFSTKPLYNVNASANDEYGNTVEQVKKLEQMLNSLIDKEQNTESPTIATHEKKQDAELTLVFLIGQHQEELRYINDYQKALKLTCNAEFMNMLYLCIFVPFLHVDTPKPDQVQPKQLGTFRKSDEYYPEKLIDEVIEYRKDLSQLQIQQQQIRARKTSATRFKGSGSPGKNKNEGHSKSPGAHYLSKKSMTNTSNPKLVGLNSPELQSNKLSMTLDSDNHRRPWNDIEKDLDDKSLACPALVPQSGRFPMEQGHSNQTGLTGQMGQTGQAAVIDYLGHKECQTTAWAKTNNLYKKYNLSFQGKKGPGQQNAVGMRPNLNTVRIPSLQPPPHHRNGNQYAMKAQFKTLDHRSSPQRMPRANKNLSPIRASNTSVMLANPSYAMSTSRANFHHRKASQQPTPINQKSSSILPKIGTHKRGSIFDPNPSNLQTMLNSNLQTTGVNDQRTPSQLDSTIKQEDGSSAELQIQRQRQQQRRVLNDDSNVDLLDSINLPKFINSQQQLQQQQPALMPAVSQMSALQKIQTKDNHNTSQHLACGGSSYAADSHDRAIGHILKQKGQDFTSLFNHPKFLVGMFTKPNQLLTREQRIEELKYQLVGVPKAKAQMKASHPWLKASQLSLSPSLFQGRNQSLDKTPTKQSVIAVQQVQKEASEMKLPIVCDKKEEKSQKSRLSQHKPQEQETQQPLEIKEQQPVEEEQPLSDQEEEQPLLDQEKEQPLETEIEVEEQAEQIDFEEQAMVQEQAEQVDVEEPAEQIEEEIADEVEDEGEQKSGISDHYTSIQETEK